MDDFNAVCMVSSIEDVLAVTEKCAKTIAGELNANQSEFHFNDTQRGMIEIAGYHLARFNNEMKKLAHDLRIDYRVDSSEVSNVRET